ncbi:uncharacterized protein JCM6883_001751 [Sporobolomyces salmoneus]|uniref:uncharacterized protein n=1 Tax=Sporobolomyces salmoneus TaxID=183962 RepID=UPI003181F093
MPRGRRRPLPPRQPGDPQQEQYEAWQAGKKRIKNLCYQHQSNTPQALTESIRKNEATLARQEAEIAKLESPIQLDAGRSHESHSEHRKKKLRALKANAGRSRQRLADARAKLNALESDMPALGEAFQETPNISQSSSFHLVVPPIPSTRNFPDGDLTGSTQFTPRPLGNVTSSTQQPQLHPLATQPMSLHPSPSRSNSLVTAFPPEGAFHAPLQLPTARQFRVQARNSVATSSGGGTATLVDPNLRCYEELVAFWRKSLSRSEAEIRTIANREGTIGLNESESETLRLLKAKSEREKEELRIAEKNLEDYKRRKGHRSN